MEGQKCERENEGGGGCSLRLRDSGGGVLIAMVMI